MEKEIRKRLLSRAIPAVVVLFLGAVAFLPVCDLSFDCGCRAPGLGGHSHCDIHTSGPPDCPWCDHDWAGYAAMALSASIGLVVVWVLPRGARPMIVIVAGLGALLGGALVAGVATSLWLGLPVLAGW